MILILSDERDQTTIDVISWLRFYKKDFLRINLEDSFDFSDIEIEDQNVKINFKSKQLEFDFSKISSYWYRRGKLNFNRPIITPQKVSGLQTSAKIFLDREYTAISEFIYSQLESKRSIGKINQNLTNKITNLIYAQKAGLKVPHTKIITAKKDLIAFFSKNRPLLTKTITQSGFSFSNDEIKFEGLSSLFTQENLDVTPSFFSPTLFQSFIDKAYELRVFYLDGVCYTSAIFSQNDERTRVDFRDYNFEKPNRTPPYKLPSDIENSIVKFMDSVDMRTGSLDILVSKNKEYVFLEVNPIGQFRQVSYPCNYYLEKRVADYLSFNKQL
ncbi:grasp-with-spasm system ATP-grasp peptide maturase [Pedobacter sandarakinus]|uniref:grasp-with-spasm system ATP-grasp peptide maturase n=1 Tax=Pedobacter sandarakinus TaxID=353156 RepID=UPI0022461F72|nr:grasp-with-spasm system ATP-grasp peptide maturase [Pedobacter sandarakinus]MCX2575958.1 grasp-with-spasm system ATP-grasp peptide maturase [Pedobacter sandarakinus]